MPDDAPERKLACWLSRDGEDGDQRFVQRWNRRPEARQGIGGRKLGWASLVGGASNMTWKECLNEYGVCPAKGQAIPVYYVAGEPISKDD